MNINEDINTRFRRLKCCVIIPTFNNSATVEQVINGVAALTDSIIVVNDGSTDGTSEILKKFPNVEVLSYPKNKGKGFALKTGFDKATEMGFDYAITIDSDGQHKPEEIPLFLSEIEKNPDILVVGVRNFNQENIPKKSNFANRFSNFWFHFITDCKLSDTQSGYRLYPLNIINKFKLRTGKYEFELEILVRTAWKGIDIVSVPVNAYYPPAEKRVTHFRPFRDFARISLLNTVLFFITILYIKPYNVMKNLNKNLIKEFFRNNIIASKDTDTKIVLSVMFGIFMGVVPIWGYQMIVALALAHVLKLNKVLVIIAANISIAPMIPVILYMSYRCGFIMGLKSHNVAQISDISWEFIQNNLVHYVVGSILFGILLALAFGILVFILLKIFRKPKAINLKS